MPTWGWFIVALVFIDVLVLVAWLLARKSPRKARSGAPGVGVGAWEDIVPKLRSLKEEGRAITAIELLRARTGLSSREAKEAVDRL